MNKHKLIEFDCYLPGRKTNKLGNFLHKPAWNIVAVNIINGFQKTYKFSNVYNYIEDYMQKIEKYEEIY